MFGAPDWTELLGRSGPDHLSELFVSGAQQALNLMRHTNETLNLVQQQVGHLVEQQTAQVAQQMRQGVEEVSRRTEQTLDQLRNTTQEAMSEAERASEESGESARRGASTRSRRRG
jgi:methyl-accepting chemotaxis protein